MTDIRDSDLVIVGAGLAGLTTALSSALAAAPAKVTILTKTDGLGSGSSWWAQGGVASVWDPSDTVRAHVEDTLAAGDGLADRKIAALLAREGPDAVASLIERGMEFDRDAGGKIDLAREGGHRCRRILHAGGDKTGRALTRFLLRLVGMTPSITIERGAFAWDLIVRDANAVGLLAYHESSGWILHRAPQIVIASGGSGQLYGRTTNPAEATGDAIALAARAGATLKDLEFVQFHPTALAAGRGRINQRTPLLTEALRGEGAVLIDETGARIMEGTHPMGDLAPRDIVARAVEMRIRDGHTVFLDTRNAIGAAIAERFPTVHTQCLEAGVDPVRDRVAIAPAAHYHMGGIETDGNGRTSLAGLWACGEAACTGLHGANRIAGNSLLECLLFGRRVAAAIGAERRGCLDTRPLDRELPDIVNVPKAATERAVVALRDILQTVMYDRVGLFRDATGLQSAVAEIEALRRQITGLAQADRAVPPGPPATMRHWGELRNMVLAAQLIARAALDHRGCRGAHFRTDYREPAQSWSRRTLANGQDERAA